MAAGAASEAPIAEGVVRSRFAQTLRQQIVKFVAIYDRYTSAMQRKCVVAAIWNDATESWNARALDIPEFTLQASTVRGLRAKLRAALHERFGDGSVDCQLMLECYETIAAELH